MFINEEIFDEIFVGEIKLVFEDSFEILFVDNIFLGEVFYKLFILNSDEQLLLVEIFEDMKFSFEEIIVILYE